MDITISPEQLRRIREFSNLKTSQAADLVRVSKRTWESYETPSSLKSSRTIPDAVLELFCLKANLPFPPLRDDGVLSVDVAKVISFTSLKGGIGKTPITIEAAAVLSQQGYSVGIVLAQSVIRSHEAFCEIPKFTNPKYYEEEDVLFSKHELIELNNELISKGVNPDREDEIDKETRSFNRYDLNKYKRKVKAKYNYEQLLKDHDFIFLDIGPDLEKSILHCDLIVSLISIRSILDAMAGLSTTQKIKSLNGGKLPEKVVGLCIGISSHHYENEILTIKSNSDSNNSQTLYYGDDENFKTTCLSEAISETLLNNYEHKSHYYKIAHSSDIPMLNSSLSNAYSTETELICRKNQSLCIGGQLKFYDTLVNLAPNSMPSIEMKGLVHEIKERLRILSGKK